MQLELLLVSLLIIFGFIILYLLFNKKISTLSKNDDKSLLEWLKSMQNSLDNSSTSMIRTLQENSRQLNERLDKATSVIGEVNKEVGQMSEIGRNMRDLQEFLKSPKLRGNIGEQVLKDLISQMFPKNSFNLQYEFKSGEKVDAAIKTDAGILPVDSKFPMENFQKMIKAESEKDREFYKKELIKDVKKHISSISKKYILPEEGTMDFALMYVPSEAVFYEVVNDPMLMEFSRIERVYPVSPSTLYAHLQTILLSFEGKRIETKSQEIIQLLRAVQKDYQKVNDNMSILGKHINNTYAQYANVHHSFGLIGQKLSHARQFKKNSNPEIDEETT